MTKCLISILCLGVGLQAEEPPGADLDRRVMTYLQNLTDEDIGRRLEGVRVDGENTVLAGNTLLHRIRLPSKRAHVYVMREGPPGIKFQKFLRDLCDGSSGSRFRP